MKKVTVYTKHNCPACELTKTILVNEGIEFKTVNVEEDSNALDYIKNTLGFTSVPVVEVEGSESFAGFQPEKLKELSK